MVITVCGGGNVAHSIIAMAPVNFKINLLTRNPEKWSDSVSGLCCDRECRGKINKISSDPKDVIPESDIVILTVPSFAVREVLNKIRKYIRKDAWIGRIPGTGQFELIASEVLGCKTKIFGLQRVPYICRIIEYGKSVNISGIKNNLFLGTLNGEASHLSETISELFAIPVVILDNYYYISLTTSNAILHPARLYGLFSDWKPGDIFQRPPYFYEDWNDFSSEVLFACDNEFEAVKRKIGIDSQILPSLMNHYDSENPSQLTEKMRSIAAFKGIETAMEKNADGYIPDFSNRYFTEDIPFGLLFLKKIAELFSCKTPNIDKILFWAGSKMNQEFITGEGHVLCREDDLKDKEAFLKFYGIVK